MLRFRFLTAAIAISVVGCADNPNSVLTGPIDPSPPIQPSAPSATIAGRIVVTTYLGERTVDLLAEDGHLYRLVGAESRTLFSVGGGEVVVRGTFDANPGFVVEAFLVTSMHGRPAIDGVLESVEEGFALRLSDGSLRPVAGLNNEDCAAHVGARMWVVGWDEAEAVFGLIAAE